LTKYGQYTVGFCNPGCRNTFDQVVKKFGLNSAIMDVQNKAKQNPKHSQSPGPVFKSNIDSMRGIDHINFGMPSGEEAEHLCRQFYSGVLGFAEVEKPPRLRSKFGGLWFDIPNTRMQIHFSVDKKREDGSRVRDFGHLAFHVDDIETVEKKLRVHNVHINVPDQGDVPGVTRRFFFFDPFNNEIEFLHKDPNHNNNGTSNRSKL